MRTQTYLAKYPKRGEIFIADLNPGFGREVHKKRPVLVISSDILNKNSFSLVVIPFSSIVPPFNQRDVVIISKAEGLEKDSVLLVDKIRAIDTDRLIKKVGKLSKEKMLEVEESLKLVLGMVELD